MLFLYQFLFLLFHNLFCEIVLLAKRVNHFDRKKNLIFDFFVLGFLSQTVGKRSRLSTPFPKKEKKNYFWLN